MKADKPMPTVKIEGSEKAAPEGHKLESLNANDSIEVTIRIRRKKSIEDALAKGEQFTRAEYEIQFGSAEADMVLVEDFAHEHHLSIWSKMLPEEV